jgi:hypothetical protein
MDPRENDSYSFKVVENKKRKKKRLLVLIVASLIGTVNGQSYAYGVEQSDLLKLYAHSRIINYEQFKCFDVLITRESRWSYLARNGSHYGLGQMRSTWYRDLDPYRQIDATLKYIAKRYKTPCKALAFHSARSYY